MLRSAQQQITVFLEVFSYSADIIPLLPGRRWQAGCQIRWSVRNSRAWPWLRLGRWLIISCWLLQPFTDSNPMKADLARNRTIREILLSQRVHLIVLGWTRMPPQRVGVW